MCGVRLVATCHFVPILLSGKILFPSARDPLNHLQHNNSRRQTTAAPARSNAQHPVVMAANAYTKSMSHTDTATQISYVKSSLPATSSTRTARSTGEVQLVGPVRPPGRLAVGPPIHAAAQRPAVHTAFTRRGRLESKPAGSQLTLRCCDRGCIIPVKTHARSGRMKSFRSLY